MLTKQLFSLFLSSVVSFSLIGQSKADKLYDNLSYAQAAPIYKIAYGSDSSNHHALRRLASCYFHMNMPDKAEGYYAKVANLGDASAEEIYNYTWALKSNQKYDDANTWMKKFYEKSSDDSRAIQHITKKKTFDQIKQNDGRFTVEKVGINTMKADFSPSYFPKEDKIAFVSARGKVKAISRRHSWNHSPYFNIYEATVDASGSLSNVNELHSSANKKFHEGPLTFTPDGKRVFFTRNNMVGNDRGTDGEGVTHLKIYSCEISEDGSWMNEKEFPFNSNEYSVGHPTLSADGLTMYFASDKPGGIGKTDIYKTSLSGGSWTNPENLGDKVNTEGDEMFPFISKEDVLLFASNGRLGLGGLDIFVASKAGSGFAEAKNLGGSINTSRDDFGLIVSSSGNEGYFSSNRADGSGDDDIYRFTGSIIKPVYVTGVVTDQKTNELLTSSVVKLLDKDGNVLDEQTVGDDAVYNFGVSAGESYSITATKPEYEELSEAIDINKEAEGEIKKDISLGIPGVKLLGKVIEKDAQTPIENAKVDVVDNGSGKIIYQFNTKSDGTFQDNLEARKGDKLNYYISVSAPGYLTKSGLLSKTIGDEKIIDVTKELDIALNKIDVGADIGKIININPIYFDVNKSDIRPDAAFELDKIVRVLKDNPNMVIELGSHTDCRGSAKYNRNLSDKRAKSSAQYVKSKIDDPTRIYGKGYGESQLVNDCACEGAKKSKCSDDEHQLNRRTEFKIVKM